MDSHPSSIQEPVFSNRKAFTKEKLSLQKSRRHIVPRFFPASFPGAGLRRQLRQSAARQEEKTPPLRDFHFWKEKNVPRGSLLRLRLLLRPQALPNRGGERAAAGRPGRFAAVADEEFEEFERDSRGKRDERFEFDEFDEFDGSDEFEEFDEFDWPHGGVAGSGETVEGVSHGGSGESASEGDAAEAGDRAVGGNGETDAGGAGSVTCGASEEPEGADAAGERESEQLESDVGVKRRIEGREKGLLERKRQQENQLTESLLSHYRSTVEDQVTDVQRRVRERKKRVRNS